MTSLIPTHCHWLTSEGKWMVPAAYSEKLRDRETVGGKDLRRECWRFKEGERD